MKTPATKSKRSASAKQPATPSTRSLLERLFNQPTAPFREGFVRNEIARILDEHGIPHFLDRTGNLIAGATNFVDLGRGFRIGLMAHMDHPGFHLDEQIDARTWRCRWYGGAPWPGMPGAKIRLYSPHQTGLSIAGRITDFPPPARPDDDGVPFTARFSAATTDFPKESFGGFDFAGFDAKGDRVHTRAADDIAGCVIALGALIDQEAARRLGLRSKTEPRRLSGFFTRAEEVGFVGCSDLLASKRLRQNIWFVSLEASKALPEAEIGLGPVLRIGDATCLFDKEFSAVLWSTARKLREADKKSKSPFGFQRRLMSGGTCEATPLVLNGFQVTGLAVPLGNYHNGKGPSGKQKPGPEIISVSDTEKARRLCTELGATLQEKPRWEERTRLECEGYYRDLKSLLSTNVRYDGDWTPARG